MKKYIKGLVGLLLYLMLLYVMVVGMKAFVVGQKVVDGPSMNDTLEDGDRMLVNKFSYRFFGLDRFDIVVFDYEYEADTDYIKRVIGLPGETVRIDKEGNIYINDELLEENYGKEVIEDPGMAVDGITLGKNEYFVLGDNRNNSSDSRDADVGPVRKDQIFGHAWLRLKPNFGLVR